MKIYIASSWKNQHAVEMLTDILRNLGHEVVSFVEHEVVSFVEQAVEAEWRDLKFDVEAWLDSDDSNRKFDYDTAGATKSDIMIYIGPSGTDAWAEVGAAWAAGVPISGLWAKGEPAGLMRKMVYWFTDYRELLKTIKPVKKGGI